LKLGNRFLRAKNSRLITAEPELLVGEGLRRGGGEAGGEGTFRAVVSL